MNNITNLRQENNQVFDKELDVFHINDKLDCLADDLATLMRILQPAKIGLQIATSDADKSLAIAKNLYAKRRYRQKVFGSDLFGEPAWDILLDLYIATETGKPISITSACIGSDVSLTTALRWLLLLEKRGLVLREDDSTDLRRRHVRLSELGMEQMTRYLSAC